MNKNDYMENKIKIKKGGKVILHSESVPNNKEGSCLKIKIRKVNQ